MIFKIKDTFEDDLKMISNDHDYLTLRFRHFDTFGTFEFLRDHFEILEGSFEVFWEFHF